MWRRAFLVAALLGLAASLGTPALRAQCEALSLGHTGSGADPTAIPLGDGTVWNGAALNTNLNLAQYVSSADVDGDGSIDALGAVGSQIFYWRNVAGDGSVWEQVEVDGDYSSANAANPGDIDGDGDIDIVGASGSLDDVTWWENVAGDGSTWAEHTVDGDLNVAASAVAADMDGDGDLDIVAGAFTGQKVVWYENRFRDGMSWRKRTIDGSIYSESVVAVDLDADGDMDVLGNSFGAGSIFWWENVDGDGTVWTEHLVSDMSPGSDSIGAVDIDGDGDLDVIDAANNVNQVRWWENLDGDGNSWLRHAVDIGFRIASVSATDLDGDGDADIVGSSDAIDGLAWWENSSGDGTTWLEHVIDAGFSGSRSVTTADLDGDGAPDVLSANPSDDVVSWFRNTYAFPCPAGEYEVGDVIALTSTPDPGSGVGGWTGTDDDLSTSVENRVTISEGGATVSADYLAGCFALSVDHTGSGADPIVSPVNSDGCAEATFVVGAEIALSATPDLGWLVTGWTGTDDDSTAEFLNQVTMPAADHLVSVDYSADETCYRLLIRHRGDGGDPLADPTNSPGCGTSRYLAGSSIALTAAPDSGWEVEGWLGTIDDTSTDVENTVIMPASDHRSGAAYIESQ